MCSVSVSALLYAGQISLLHELTASARTKATANITANLFITSILLPQIYIFVIKYNFFFKLQALYQTHKNKKYFLKDKFEFISLPLLSVGQ